MCGQDPGVGVMRCWKEEGGTACGGDVVGGTGRVPLGDEVVVP